MNKEAGFASRFGLFQSVFPSWFLPLRPRLLVIHHDLITCELTQSTWLLGDGLLILDSFPRRCVLSRDKMLLSCVPRFWPTPLVSTLAWGEDESRRNNKYDLSDSFSSRDQKAQTHLPKGCPEQGMGRRKFLGVPVTAKHRSCVLLVG